MVLGFLDYSKLPQEGIIAAFLAFGMILLIAAFVVYIYTTIALMFIAKKTKTKNGWLAWIPIANIYLITQMAGISGWWTLIVLALIVPFIGGLAMLIAIIWMFWRIAEKIDFPGWTSLLLIIPIINLVILGIWAWAKR